MRGDRWTHDRSFSAHVSFCSEIWREAADIGQLENVFGRRQNSHASALKLFRKSTVSNMLVEEKGRSVSGELI